MNWNKTSEIMPEKQKFVLCAYNFSFYEYHVCLWTGTKWNTPGFDFCPTPDFWCEITSPIE